MSPGFSIRDVGRLLVCTLDGTPTVDVLVAIRGAVARRSDRPSVLVVVPSGARPPDPDVRKVALQTLRELDGAIGAWVVVLRTNLVVRAAFRGVVGALLLAARIRLPVVLFESTERAADWLALRGLFSGSHRDLDALEDVG